MADYGIKISKDGYDVKTCADIDLIFKSGDTLLKCKTERAGTVELVDGFAQVDHNLGYKPQFLVYGLVEYPGDDPYVRFMQTTNPIFEFVGVFAGVDDNSLYIYADGYTTAARFFIFDEGI